MDTQDALVESTVTKVAPATVHPQPQDTGYEVRTPSGRALSGSSNLSQEMMSYAEERQAIIVDLSTGAQVWPELNGEN